MVRRARAVAVLACAWALALTLACELGGCGSGSSDDAADGAGLAGARAPSSTTLAASEGSTASATSSASGAADTAAMLDATARSPATDVTPKAACAPVRPDEPTLTYADARGRTVALTPVCADVMVDAAGWPAARVDALRDEVDAAAAIVTAFFGADVPRNAPAHIVICSTADCSVWFAGSAVDSATLYPHGNAGTGRYVTDERLTIVVAAAALAAGELVRALAHELTHHHIYGVLNGRLDLVPAWFNEGVATMVGGMPWCEGVVPATVSLASVWPQTAWNRMTHARPFAEQLYCEARNEVDRWTALNGRARLLQLIEQVAVQSTSFDEGYGSPVASPR